MELMCLFLVAFEDCFCAVRIIDESLPSGIHIHFFLPTIEDLPAIENVGDIVLLNQVVVNE